MSRGPLGKPPRRLTEEETQLKAELLGIVKTMVSDVRPDLSAEVLDRKTKEIVDNILQTLLED